VHRPELDPGVRAALRAHTGSVPRRPRPPPRPRRPYTFSRMSGRGSLEDSGITFPGERPRSVPAHVGETVARALAEDAPDGDLTSILTLPATARCRAILLAGSDGVLAGEHVASAVFEIVCDQDALGRVALSWTLH